MTLLNNLIDNNYVSYGLFATTAGFIGYLVIKSYFYTTVIQTPNSPPTFNFTLDQLKECGVILDRGEALAQEDRDKLDLDLQTIMGEEQYNQFNQELNAEFERELFSSFNNSGIDYTSILELIDIITNLISHFYF
jgi:hypothetical protein